MCLHPEGALRGGEGFEVFVAGQPGDAGCCCGECECEGGCDGEAVVFAAAFAAGPAEQLRERPPGDDADRRGQDDGKDDDLVTFESAR